MSGLGNGGPDDNDAQAGDTAYGMSEPGCPPVTGTHGGGLAVVMRQREGKPGGGKADYAHQLTSGGGKPGQGYPAIRDEMAVRRLTTVECSRLQGFPDDWFGEPNAQPDGPRYAGLGDAVTVNVAEWIGRRIGSVESQPTDREETSE